MLGLSEISEELEEKGDFCDKNEEILKKIEVLSRKCDELEKESYSLKKEKNNDKFHFENEKIVINEQINFLQENLNNMNKRLEECNEIIRNLHEKNEELEKIVKKFQEKINEEKFNEKLKEKTEKSKENSYEKFSQKSHGKFNEENTEKSNENFMKKNSDFIDKLEKKLIKKKEKVKFLKKSLIESQISLKNLENLRKDDNFYSKDSKILRKSLGNSISFEEKYDKNLYTNGDFSDEFEIYDISSLNPNEISKKIEAFKQKTRRNKEKFQMKLKEFEAILRFFEKNLDFLINNNRIIEEKDQYLEEILDKNEILKEFTDKMKSSFMMLSMKFQRNLASEREFIIKIGNFLTNSLKIHSEKLKDFMGNFKENAAFSDKSIDIHNIKGIIAEIIDDFEENGYKTPSKKEAIFISKFEGIYEEKTRNTQVFLEKIKEKWLKKEKNVKKRVFIEIFEGIIDKIGEIWLEDLRVSYEICRDFNDEGLLSGVLQRKNWRKKELEGITELCEEFQRFSFENERNSNKNGESLVFLKEIYSDLKGFLSRNMVFIIKNLEIIGKCSFFSSKLDEKAKKLPNFTKIITEDSFTIFKVLDENLAESERNYTNSLKFLWENCKEKRGFLKDFTIFLT